MRLAVFLKAYKATAAQKKSAANDPEMQSSFKDWVESGDDKGWTKMGWGHAGWVDDNGKVTAAGQAMYGKLQGGVPAPKAPKKKAASVAEPQSASSSEKEKSTVKFGAAATTGPHNGLIPMKKMVHKGGKVFQQTYWVSPEDAASMQKLEATEEAPKEKSAHVKEDIFNHIMNSDLKMINTVTSDDLNDMYYEYAPQYFKDNGLIEPVKMKGSTSFLPSMDHVKLTPFGEEIQKKVKEQMDASEAELEADTKAKLDELEPEEKVSLNAFFKKAHKDKLHVDINNSDIVTALLASGYISDNGDGDFGVTPKGQTYWAKLKKELAAASPDFDEFKKLIDTPDEKKLEHLKKVLASAAAGAIAEPTLVPKDQWPELFVTTLSTKKKKKMPKEAVYAVIDFGGYQWAIHPQLALEGDKSHDFDSDEWKITELTTGMGGGASSVKSKPWEAAKTIFSVGKAKLDEVVAKGLEQTKECPFKGALTFDAEHIVQSKENTDDWMEILGLDEKEDEPPPLSSSSSSGQFYTPEAIEHNGLTWEPEMLQQLDEWCGSHSFCKTLRSAFTRDIDKMQESAEHNEQYHHSKASTETARMFEKHVTPLKDKMLYRGTNNRTWADVPVGDFVPFGIGSVSRDMKKGHGFGEIHLHIIPAPGEQLRGVDIDDLEQNGPKEEVSRWLHNTENANRYKDEREIALRCKAFKMVSKVQSTENEDNWEITVMAWNKKVPKLVLKKSEAPLPKTWWNLWGDIGSFAEARAQKKADKK